MPRGLSHYKIIVVCYVSGAKSLRVCILCEYKNAEEKKNQRITRNLLRNAKLLIWRDALHSRDFSPCVRQAACMVKNKTTPPAPSPALGRLPPPTPLTCIAGLVGVKIDRQSLNWKWSLNAGYSCWGFEFSLTPANRAADGENWRGICRRAEQWGHGEWIDPVSAYPGAQASAPRTRAGPQITTVELRWAMLLSARLVMRTRVLEHRVTCWSWIQLQTTMAVTVRKPKNLCHG